MPGKLNLNQWFPRYTARLPVGRPATGLRGRKSFFHDVAFEGLGTDRHRFPFDRLEAHRLEGRHGIEARMGPEPRFSARCCQLLDPLIEGAEKAAALRRRADIGEIDIAFGCQADEAEDLSIFLRHDDVLGVQAGRPVGSTARGRDPCLALALAVMPAPIADGVEHHFAELDMVLVPGDPERHRAARFARTGLRRCRNNSPGGRRAAPRR